MTDRPSETWPNLHARLRDETHHLHDALETAVDVSKVVQSRSAYASYLTRLWHVHASAEATLCALDFSPFGFDYSHRQRSRHLAADLLALDLPIPAQYAPAIPRFASLREALGAVYVVEGSALGARAILPQIKSSLGVDETRGATFFIGLGPDGKAIWKACLAAIAAIQPDSPQATDVVTGANAAFAHFARHLPQPATSGRREAAAIF